jgi:tetratricopeptide (TPR) repeat protein
MRFWQLLVLAPLLIGAAADPRPGLVELQMEARQTAALQQVEQFLQEDNPRAQAWGMDYLRGHLLEQAQRAAEAPAAFETAIEMTPQLADYASYRIALNHFESGRPGAAAERLANLLAENPSAPLIPKAAQLLNRALAEEGGGCGVLDGWQSWGLDRARTREIQIPLVDCALEAGETDRAMELMVAILRGSREDEAALEAAMRMAALFPADMDPPTALRVGLALHHHRDFAGAIPLLESSLEDSTSSTRGLGQVDETDILYALARSHYWQGHYKAAAERFTLAADQGSAAKDVARALFQRGRCLALEGNWDGAVTSYRRAADADPNGSWAAAALLSALRLEWRQDREETALALFEEIRSRGSWRSSLERAALFLATSDLVRGRTVRAGAWLDLASHALRRDSSEIGYWRGRLAELENRPSRALDHYLSVVAADRYHPLAQSAIARWSQGKLREAAHQRAIQLTESGSTSDLLQAWLLVPADHPRKTELRQQLLERLRQSSRNRPFIEMRAVAPAEWPLWKQRVRRSEDILLGLGLIETMSASVRSAFPLQDTALALSGSELLVVNGLHRSSLYSAEVIGRRIPSGLPQAFLPTSFRRLLYPRP